MNAVKISNFLLVSCLALAGINGRAEQIEESFAIEPSPSKYLECSSVDGDYSLIFDFNHDLNKSEKIVFSPSEPSSITFLKETSVSDENGYSKTVSERWEAAVYSGEMNVVERDGRYFLKSLSVDLVSKKDPRQSEGNLTLKLGLAPAKNSSTFMVRHSYSGANHQDLFPAQNNEELQELYGNNTMSCEIVYQPLAIDDNGPIAIDPVAGEPLPGVAVD